MRHRTTAAAASASAASARPPRALRPLLFLMLSLFLVLPMLIYNFATLDPEKFAHWADTAAIRGALHLSNNDLDQQFTVDDTKVLAGLPTELRACAAVNASVLRSREQVVALQQLCFASQAQGATDVVADMVHFVYLPVQMVPLLKGEAKPPGENFTMVQFAAFQSIRKHVKPALMVLHYPATEPRSYWYTQCQRYLSLHRVTFPALPTSRPSSLNVYQRRDVIQLVLALRAIRKQGGVVFTDFNTFVLRPTRLLRQLPFFAGRARFNTLSISRSMLSAGLGNAVVAYLESKLLKMLEDDDVRLRNTPLNDLLGELILEKNAQGAPGAAITPNVVLASPSVLEAMPPTKINAFFKTKLEDSTATLRDAVAFQVPASQVVAAQGYSTLVALQSTLNSYEVLAEDATVFGAIIRYAISLNQTSELDAVLYR